MTDLDEVLAVLSRAAPENPLTIVGDADCQLDACIGCYEGPSPGRPHEWHRPDCWWVAARALLERLA